MDLQPIESAISTLGTAVKSGFDPLHETLRSYFPNIDHVIPYAQKTAHDLYAQAQKAAGPALKEMGKFGQSAEAAFNNIPNLISKLRTP
ncbi:MAG: hypothetical protein JO089_09365 [Alphaproteobacteria bacterium]|nr:hypothetical protein [Alphaproteobacteria bacterium]